MNSSNEQCKQETEEGDALPVGSPQTTFHSVCQAIFSTEHGLRLSRFLPVSPAGLGMVVVYFCCPWLQATGALPVISVHYSHNLVNCPLIKVSNLNVFFPA